MRIGEVTAEKMFTFEHNLMLDGHPEFGGEEKVGGAPSRFDQCLRFILVQDGPSVLE
jgi:hypothetical protein